MVSEAEKRRVGALIRHRRQVLDLDQPGLAQRVGVSRQTVSKWETGRSYPARYAGKVEAVLGISLAEGPAPEPWKQALMDLHNLPPGLDATHLIELVDGVLKRQERHAG